ncbi:MAG: hypothetical protein Q7J80_10195 [Anaerolineales bacterium]|nr:hypothetical protein [Anaerolineales bacterium]
MQTKYPTYVAPVQSNDDYSNEPTHCAFEVRPAVILRIAWYLALTRLVQRLAKSRPEVRFYFPNISWMTLIEDDNLLDQQIVEKGGFADGDKIGFSFNIREDSLRGHEIQLYNEGYVRFLCYHKHSGVEFFSDEIRFRELFDAIRFEHVLAEFDHLILLRKARVVLRKLSLPQR